MRRPILILALIILTTRAWGLETDQYTVPPHPLEDIGPILQDKFDTTIDEIVIEINREFDQDVHQAVHSTTFQDEKLTEASELLREEIVAERLAKRWCDGLPECTIEKWAHGLRKGFELDPGKGVFGRWLLDRPVTLMELSPTVNIFGIYCGTDKIGHLFQQGHECYAIYRDNRAAGAAFATCRAVAHSVSQEHGLFGEALVGSYSNADLAADYAGLQLYLNLTRPIAINGQIHPRLLRLAHTHWERDPQAGADWLKPFFSEHFNEAHNPCRYVPLLRQTVRQNVAPRAVAWFAFYHTTPEAEQVLRTQLTTWYGEKYGHSGTAELVYPSLDHDEAIISSGR